MPLSSETQPLAHPRSRRTSRTKSICWILGVTLLSFVVFVVSPLRYFSPNDPSTGIDPTYSQYSLNTTWSVGTTTEWVKEGRVDKSGDSINVLPLYRPTVSYGDKLERVVGTFVDKVGDLVLALFGFDEQDWFDFTNEGLTRDEEDQFRELGIEGIGNGGAGGGGGGRLNSGSGLSSWSESSLYVEVSSFLPPLSFPSLLGGRLISEDGLYNVAYTISTPFETFGFRTSFARETFERVPLPHLDRYFFSLRLYLSPSSSHSIDRGASRTRRRRRTKRLDRVGSEGRMSFLEQGSGRSRAGSESSCFRRRG